MDPIVTNEDSAIANPDVLVRGEPPMMPVPSTNATSSAPVPIELTEADLKKLEAAGFDISSATNAAPREAGSVPEASASGPEAGSAPEAAESPDGRAPSRPNEEA